MVWVVWEVRMFRVVRLVRAVWVVKLVRVVRLFSRGSVIFDDLSPTHGALPITPLIDIPKGISSKMGLEVA